MLELVVRLVFSLAVVVGLLLVVTRLGSRRFRGSSSSPVRVVHRQHLSRTSSVAVVAIGERVLVLGATEHSISVLAELDPDELPEATRAERAAAEAPAPPQAVAPPLAVAAVPVGALGGSVLSPQTWKQAYAAATRRPGVLPGSPVGSGGAG